MIINFTIEPIREKTDINPSVYEVTINGTKQRFPFLFKAADFVLETIEGMEEQLKKQLTKLYRQGIFTEGELVKSKSIRDDLGECLACRIKLSVVKERLEMEIEDD